MIKISVRTKELILKTLIVIGISLMILVFPGTLVWAYFFPYETAQIIFNVILFSSFGVGGLFIILLFVFGDLPSKPVKADKVPLTIYSYDELLCFLQNRLLEKDYKKQQSVAVSPDGALTLYLKRTKRSELECFVIMRVADLSDKFLDNANESITSILNEYYGGKTIRDTVNMISVFCVDRITPAFQKLVNSNMQQGLKNGRFVVGISFGGNKIYIARQEGGYGVRIYKRMRKEFMEVMNLQNPVQ